MEFQSIAGALIASSLATGLVAGVFLTFSDFVMPSLRAAQPAAGTEAMQIINRKVYRSVFMVLLIGMIPVSALIVVYGAVFAAAPAAGYLITGGLAYVVGVFVVSAVGNIPMNQRLEAMPQGGDAAQSYWPGYVRGWVIWNHLRVASSTVAAFCYVMAAVVMVQPV